MCSNSPAISSSTNLLTLHRFPYIIGDCYQKEITFEEEQILLSVRHKHLNTRSRKWPWNPLPPTDRVQKAHELHVLRLSLLFLASCLSNPLGTSEYPSLSFRMPLLTAFQASSDSLCILIFGAHLTFSFRFFPLPSIVPLRRFWTLPAKMTMYVLYTDKNIKFDLCPWKLWKPGGRKIFSLLSSSSQYWPSIESFLYSLECSSLS